MSSSEYNSVDVLDFQNMETTVEKLQLYHAYMASYEHSR